ncbi:MAG: helix-turn-helix domain-containing protein [Treponema sp.]|nr:helix-turn-helix domain-containing protein [Treponema sp.]
MTEDELQTRVISNIRALRKKAGLSQEKLADKADISRQMMNDIEGRRRWLTKKTLVKLANALEVDVYKLFLPSANENETTKGIYDYITKEVVLQIKDAVDKTLDKF